VLRFDQAVGARRVIENIVLMPGGGLVVESLKNPPKDVETTNEVAEPSLTDRQWGESAATYKSGAAIIRITLLIR